MSTSLITRLSNCLNLEPTILEGLAVIASPFAIESGEFIFRQGETAIGMYVVDHGRVQIKARIPGDDALSIVELGEGEIFGELAFLDEEDRSASAIAVTAVTGWSISRAGFRGLLHGRQPVARNVLECIQKKVAGRIRQTLYRIIESSSVINLQRRTSVVSPRWSIPEASIASLLETFSMTGLMLVPRWVNLLEQCHLVEISRGARFDFDEGDEGRDSLLWVLRGAIRECVARGDELEQLWVTGPGALGAVVGFVDGEPHPLTLQAAEDSLVLALPRHRLAHLEAQDSLLAIFLQNLIGQQLALAQRRVNRHLGRAIGLHRFNHVTDH